MNQQSFIRWLRPRVPAERWEQFWWLTPTVALAVLPVGIAVLQLVGKLGWAGAGRALQGLILLSIIAGPAVGFVILWCLRSASLSERLLVRTQWLARLLIVGPILFILFLFWVSNRR